MAQTAGLITSSGLMLSPSTHRSSGAHGAGSAAHGAGSGAHGRGSAATGAESATHTHHTPPTPHTQPRQSAVSLQRFFGAIHKLKPMIRFDTVTKTYSGQSKSALDTIN